MRHALSIFLGGLLLFFAIVLLIVLYQLFNLLVVLFLGMMLAQAISPAIHQMERRRIPRPLGVLLIYALLAAIVSSVGWLILPPLAADLSALLARLPELADGLVVFLTPWRELLERFQLLEEVREGLRQVAGNLAQSFITFITLPLAIVNIVVSFFTVFVFAFLFSVRGGRIQSFLLSLVHPDQRADWERVLRKMGDRVGGFVRSELILMTSVGLLTWLGLSVLHIPFAHLLAVVAFLTEAIPMVGPFLGGIPAVAVALFVSPLAAVQVIVLYVLVQQMENYLLAPLVHGRQLQISPLLVILSLLVGSALFGLGGALIAVPLTAALQVVVEDVVVPWRRRQIGEGAEKEASARPAAGGDERERGEG